MSNKITEGEIVKVQKKVGKKLTLRQKRLLEELPKAKNLREAGLKAGYKDSKYLPQTVYHAINNWLQEYVDKLGLVGLNTLEEVAVKGKNEIARVNAATKLVEQAYGKPKDQTPVQGNILIQINKI